MEEHSRVEFEGVGLDSIACPDDDHCRFTILLSLDGAPGGTAVGQLTRGADGWFISEIPG